MADIEPYKKKKVEKESEGKPFVMKNDIFTKASGEPEAKINGIGTMEVEPEEKPKPPGKTVTSRKDFNEVLRNELLKHAFGPEAFGFGGRDSGFKREVFHADHYYNRYQEDPGVVKVSLEEALMREFELCRMNHLSISSHVTRTLGYIRQYIENKEKL